MKRYIQKRENSDLIIFLIESDRFYILKRMYSKFHANRSKLEDLYKEDIHRERLLCI